MRPPCGPELPPPAPAQARCAGRDAPRAARASRTGCRAAPGCPPKSPLRPPSVGDHVRGLAAEHGEQRGELVTHIATIADQVDRALLEQELGTLEAFGQLLAHGLLD